MSFWSLSVVEFLNFHLSNLHSRSYKRDAGLLCKENYKHFRVTMSCWSLFGLPAGHYYPTSHCVIWLSEGDKCEMILIDEGNRGNKDSFYVANRY